MDKKLEEREKELVEKLRSICDGKGKEKEPSKSAKILHQLGLIYMERSPDMISLIRSAALMNAAITRKPDNVEDIQKDLQALCRRVLRVAQAERPDADLVNKATDVKKDVEKMREKVERSLKNVKIHPQNVNESEMKNLNCDKIAAIQNIQKQITAKYKEIMANLSLYCVGVLGNAPCEFAHVGMGSMARSEITPYSDFENIIVLEEGCQKEDDAYHQKIIPYFRWYAILFQLILINLQETILPSVSIPSLNETTTKRGGWFFDAFTTRGISFDGMMPHACKSPLGRQHHTDSKPWKTELIKPVSKMLEYLQTEEDLKNGYHLSDILTKTCFVYGNITVYNEFEEGVGKTLNTCDENKLKEQITKQIKQDIESFSTKLCLSLPKHKKAFNFKKVVYRSTTLFISALGRLHSIVGNTCFEITGGMESRGMLTSFARRNLDLAVCLACEVRLRLYIESKSQNDSIERYSDAENKKNKLIEIIGEESCITYFQIAYALQCSICKELNIKRAYFYSDLQLTNMMIFEFLGLKEKAQKVLEYCSSNLFPETEFREFDSCLESLQKTNETQSSLAIQNNSNEHENQLNHLLRLFNSLHDLEKYNEAAEFGVRYLSLTETEKRTNDKNLTKKGHVTKKVAYALREIGAFANALKYYEKSLEIDQSALLGPDKDRNIGDTLHNMASCFASTNQYKKAMDYYETSLEIKQRTSLDPDKDRSIGAIFHSMASCFQSTNQYQKAMEYYEKSLEIKQRASLDPDKDRSIGVTLHSMASCFQSTHQYQKAMEYYEKSLEINQRTSLDPDKDRSIAVTLNNMALCFKSTHQYKKAMEYYEKSLEINQRTSLDPDKDRSISDTLHNMASCFESTQQYKKAMKYYEKSLEIKQRTSLDPDKDRIIGDTLHNMAKRFPETCAYKKSKEFFKNYQLIYRRSSFDEGRDLGLANTYYSVGLYLKDIHQFEQAMVSAEEALTVYKRITFDEKADRKVASVLLLFGLCLKEKRQYERGLEKIEEALEIYQRTSINMDADRCVADAIHGIGVFAMDTGQYEKALHSFNESLRIYEKTSLNVEADRYVARALHDIGLCLKNMGRHEQVMEYLGRALAIHRRISIDEEADSRVARLLHSIGLYYKDVGEYEVAMERLRKSLHIKQSLSLGEETFSDLVDCIEDVEQCKKRKLI